MKIILLFLLVVFAFPFQVLAGEESDTCSNRFLTIVNPVRGRDLWYDPSLESIREQYQPINSASFKATWLLQYNAIQDNELVTEIKKFNEKQEIGLLLEISEKLATSSKVIYPYDSPWFYPGAVFLSGYTRSERIRMIDRVFNEFNHQFGYTPKSVGAWWIDSFSLDYLAKKYGVKSVLIVSDQHTTDNYGVWGGWWGVPFYPSKANVLTPAIDSTSKQDMVVIQWALRDPTLSYGEGPKYSNYSLQANDYIKQGRDLSYFKHLAEIYLNCQNKVGQITVGLETGIESLGYINEYERQLELLAQTPNLKSATMSEFAKEFSAVYPLNPKEVVISATDSAWIMTPQGRINEKLSDKKVYSSNIAFADYFIADKSNFLDRKLKDQPQQNEGFYFPFWIGFFALGLIAVFLRRISFQRWILSVLFSMSAYGLILRSFYQFGWKVYIGPVADNLIPLQIGVVLVSFIVIYTVSSFAKESSRGYLLPIFCVLSFGIDPVLQSLRFTYLSGYRYFGIATDSLNFIGLKIGKWSDVKFVSQDFLPYQAAALIRADFGKVWDSLYVYLFIYPLLHIILGVLIFWSLRRINSKIGNVILFILVVLFAIHLSNVFVADPRFVVPIKK